jgi:fumarate reductase (CoM/CoB) subunit A
MLHNCDVLVIGGGAAAVRAAVEAAQPGARVILVDKGDFERSGTSPLSIHGFATTLHQTDSPDRLFQDIIDTGGNLNDHNLVRTAVAEAGREPAMLEAMGVHFHRGQSGKYDIYRGDGHSVPHGLTFDPEENGLNIVAVLGKEAWKRGVTLVEKVMITELLVEGNQVYGASGIGEQGEDHVFAAGAVVLAAGGANRIFPNVVPRIADEKYRTTGDGLALALQAGLSLVDMEMANFRNSPPASRLAARYINAKGEAFMEKYDPMLEHAARGKVVEALYREMQAGNGPIYMEITAESERVAAFSPQEYKDYVRAYKEGKRPPVTITFQRLLGGARISEDASTSIRGLYAAGESSGGFHGGDRLQGAAFLETQVFGRLAGIAALRFARTALNDGKAQTLAAITMDRIRQLAAGKTGGSAAEVIRHIQKLAWDYASIVKDMAGLNQALRELSDIKDQIRAGLDGRYIFEPLEAANLALTAEAIVRASLKREETRATHRRSDFPQAKEALARQHTSVGLANGEMSAELVPCRN